MKMEPSKSLKNTFIIVPAYNEAAVLGATVRPLVELGYSVIVVDDGSTDETEKVLGRESVFKLKHPINLGQGAALQTGIVYALDKGAQVIVTFDADGQHRAQDIKAIIEPILEGRVEVVLGSRFMRFSHKQNVPVLKRLLLRGAIMFNALLTGFWLSDAHNGLRALSREAAQKIHLRENGFAHASEIIMQIRREKLKYIEVPTKIVYTKYSKSKGQSFWNAFNIVVDIILRGILK